MRPFHFPVNTISFRLSTGILMILMPLMLLLALYDNYSIRVVRNQVALSYQKMISLYMNQVDTGLNMVDTYLSNLEILNTDVQIMESAVNDNEYMLAKMRLMTKMTQDINMYRVAGSMFVFSQTRDDLMTISNISTSVTAPAAIQDMLRLLCTDGPWVDVTSDSKWRPVPVEDAWYLVRILRTGTMYVGSWVSVDRLHAPFTQSDNNTRMLFTTLRNTLMEPATGIDQIPLQMAGDNGNYRMVRSDDTYLMVTENSGVGQFRLMALIREKKLLENLPYLQFGMKVILLSALLLLPLYYFLMRRSITAPLHRMVGIMKRIQKGDMELRIPSMRTTDEFMIVNNTFNQMMAEIHVLKIDVYEEKIQRQKAQLQHLQLQINPHFFLNSLNIIHTLARSQNYNLIQEMTLCLIRYFRYMFRSNLNFVFLRDELEHIRNYLRIQELRFPGNLQFTLDVPEFLMQVPVPPLCVQTFVENSVKYAVSMEHPSEIRITVTMEDTPGLSPYLQICIQDNGGGYSASVLQDIAVEHRTGDSNGEHIGIRNIQERLQLMYGGRASLTLRNAPQGGACACLLMPMDIDMVDDRKEGAHVERTDRG